MSLDTAQPDARSVEKTSEWRGSLTPVEAAKYDALMRVSLIGPLGSDALQQYRKELSAREHPGMIITVRNGVAYQQLDPTKL